MSLPGLGRVDHESKSGGREASLGIIAGAWRAGAEAAAEGLGGERLAALVLSWTWGLSDGRLRMIPYCFLG